MLEIPRIGGKRLEPLGDTRITGSCGCGARWEGENVCHCPTCHLSLMSVTGFDLHRFGPVGTTRCLTEVELRDKGFEPNDRGIWRRPMPADALARRTKGTNGPRSA
jgi:hypothetical protein